MSRWVPWLWIVLAAASVTSPAVGQTQYPLAIAVSDSGVVFVGDRYLPGVWKVDGNQLSLFFQGSSKFRTPLNAIRCLAIDASGALLAGDSATRDVYRLNAEGEPSPLTDGGIGIPISIAANSKGEMLVADLELHRIWRVPAAGGKAEEFAAVPAPRGVAIDAQDRLWVVSHGKDQLLRFSPNGQQQEAIVTGRPFQFPHSVALSANGTAYVSDGYGKSVWKIPAGGKPTEFVSGTPLVNPVGLAWRGENLLVADPRANAVFEIMPDGKLTSLDLQLGN